MEENKNLNKEELESVSGGLDTIFYNGVSVCPTCGHRPINLVSGDEFIDTYRCPNCGMVSYHIKKERPIPHPTLQCPTCGQIGMWKVVKSENGVDEIECKVCRHKITAPAES